MDHFQLVSSGQAATSPTVEPPSIPTFDSHSFTPPHPHIHPHSQGAEICIDGFRTTQREQMNEFFDRAFPDIPVELEDVSVSGRNWGQYDASSSSLRFLVDDKTGFEIPFNAIEKAQSASKHECSIEFSIGDLDMTQQFVESMRFHFTVHPDDAEREVTRSEEMKELIMKRITVGDSGGQAIASFPNVMCMNPRGK